MLSPEPVAARTTFGAWRWDMTAVQLFWLAVAVLLVASVIVALLKGTLYVVGDTFRAMAQRAGEPWTIEAAIESFLAIPVVYVVAAVGPAHSDSAWAPRFYGLERTARARARHAEALPAQDRTPE